MADTMEEKQNSQEDLQSKVISDNNDDVIEDEAVVVHKRNPRKNYQDSFRSRIPVRTPRIRVRPPQLRLPSEGRKACKSVIQAECQKEGSDNERSSSPSSTRSDDTVRGNEDEEDCHWNFLTPKEKKRKLSSSESIPENKYSFFQAVPDKDKRKWELPDELAAYYNDNSRKFLTEKDVCETITDEYPVPSNIEKAPRMDDFITSMLSSKTGGASITDKDKDLQKIFNKIRDVLGPLSTVWRDMELFRSGESDVPGDIDKLTELLQKSMILLGQAGNAVTYQRRLLVLGKFIDNKKAMKLIKDKSESLQNEPVNLFGNDFKKHLKDSSRASKDAKEYFSEHSNKKLKPFRAGSFPQKGGGRGHYPTSRNKNFFGSRSSSTITNRDKRPPCKIITKPLLQHTGQPRLAAKSEACPPNDRGLVFNKLTSSAISRKNKTISSKLAGYHKRPSRIKHSERVRNPSSGKTFPVKGTPPDSNEQGGGNSNQFGSEQYVRKGQ